LFEGAVRPDGFHVDSNLAIACEGVRRQVARMRHVEANRRIAVEGLKPRLATRLVGELNRRRRPAQVLAEQRAKDSPRRDESVAVSHGREARCASALIVGQDSFETWGPNGV